MPHDGWLMIIFYLIFVLYNIYFSTQVTTAQAA